MPQKWQDEVCFGFKEVTIPGSPPVNTCDKFLFGFRLGHRIHISKYPKYLPTETWDIM